MAWDSLQFCTCSLKCNSLPVKPSQKPLPVKTSHLSPWFHIAHFIRLSINRNNPRILSQQLLRLFILFRHPNTFFLEDWSSSIEDWRQICLQNSVASRGKKYWKLRDPEVICKPVQTAMSWSLCSSFCLSVYHIGVEEIISGSGITASAPLHMSPVYLCVCADDRGGQWWTLGVWRPLDGAPLLHSIILSIRVSGQWAAAHCVPAVRWGTVGMGFMSMPLSGETVLFSPYHININSDWILLFLSFPSRRFISLIIKVVKNSLLTDTSLRKLWALNEHQKLK